MERLSMAEKFTRWDAVDTLENEEEPKDRRVRHPCQLNWILQVCTKSRRWRDGDFHSRAGFCYDIPAFSLSTPLLSLKLSCAARKSWTLHGVQFF